jgi:Na+/H+ antiporter NhaD/arsenite permease-like protein
VSSIEFGLFGAILIGVMLWHQKAFHFATIGLIVITAAKLGFGDFRGEAGVQGLMLHLQHEWLVFANLAGLLLGFAILAKHFEESRLPDLLPRWLPNDWKGGLVLLFLVMVISSFLDNIAAAMIGGVVARQVFHGRVHIGYLAAIVAASNAGGAGSVVGDTTTTMMWIDGVSALDVAEAALGSLVAFSIFGGISARMQHAYQPIASDPPAGIVIDYGKLAIVALILAGAILANVCLEFPAAGVWAAILLGATFRKTPWHEVPASWKGTVFLLCLVGAASMMPVEKLPAASWQTALSLGFISAVFDNIPLTKLALDQGGYDWGYIAYAVGFGGSMIWFGSSAGVALSNAFPEAKNALLYLRHGWSVTVAYVAGFAAMLLILGWHPHAPHRDNARAAPAVAVLPGVPSATLPAP